MMRSKERKNHLFRNWNIIWNKDLPSLLNKSLPCMVYACVKTGRVIIRDPQIGARRMERSLQSKIWVDGYVDSSYEFDTVGDSLKKNQIEFQTKSPRSCSEERSVLTMYQPETTWETDGSNHETENIQKSKFTQGSSLKIWQSLTFALSSFLFLNITFSLIILNIG